MYSGSFKFFTYKGYAFKSAGNLHENANSTVHSHIVAQELILWSTGHKGVYFNLNLKNDKSHLAF